MKENKNVAACYIYQSGHKSESHIKMEYRKRKNPNALIDRIYRKLFNPTPDDIKVSVKIE